MKHQAPRTISLRRLCAVLLTVATPLLASAQVAGESVNMVSGTKWPGGDPFLQRQNEPSIAVSSANPMHLLAGANDYRTVDIPDPFQGTEPRKMPGDAWQGVFKSYDGGQTWKSTLLPGYPQDTSTDGMGSAAQSRGADGKARYNAAADSVVRAGTDGMFYFAGIVFKRGTNDGRVVLNRFIDLNNKEDGSPVEGTDSIRWVDAKVIDQGGDGTYFADKPWIAVDVPRAGALTCSIQRFGRSFQGGAIYVAWARIYSATAADIMFSRSLDCGDTWSAPLKLNDQKSQASQGASVSVDPRTGFVYVSWRRFGIAGASPQQTEDAIFAVRSFSKGGKFTHPRLVATFLPFEQAQGDWRFRTEAFPTMTSSVDATGTRSWTHIAWAQRAGNVAAGNGQVVMTHVVVTAPPKSFDEWTDPLDGWKIPPDPVDAAPILDGPAGNAFTAGHQFMPALTFSQGKLVVVYYDSRLDHTRAYYSPHQSQDPCSPVGSCWAPDDEGRWYDVERGPIGERTGLDWSTEFLDDHLKQTRHTVEVRMAMATASANPAFASSALSRMPFGERGDELDLYPTGQAAGFAGPIEVVDRDPSLAKPALRRLQDLQVNPPNLPMFKNGTTPFIGDYIDVQGPMFVRTATGWTFDTAPTSAPVFHATWTSNQDVVPPRDGDWKRYTPPARAAGTTSVYDPGQTLATGCDPGFTGTRNQNVYTARISDGLVVTSPQNAKVLEAGKARTYVVSAFNTTGSEGSFVFSFGSLPAGVVASFRPGEHAPTSTVTIPARSAAVQTVIMSLEPGKDPTTANPATTVVNVDQVGGPLQGSVTLNPPGLTFGLLPLEDGTGSSDAGERLDVQLSAASLYYANLSNANLSNANLSNANLSNANLSNANLSNANLSNTSIDYANLSNFTLEAAHIYNANLSNANLSNANLSNANLSNANLSNANLSNANLSNAALADIDYTVTNTGNTSQGFDVRLFTTDLATIGAENRIQLIVSRPYAKPIAKDCALLEQPDNQLVVNAGVVEPSTNLAGQAPLATFGIAPRETVRVTLRTYLEPAAARALATVIAPVITPQGRPTDFTYGLIITRPMGAEAARVGQPYALALEAKGGRPPLTWSLESGTLPPGLAIVGSQLAGTPSSVGPGTYRFTIKVVDTAVPQNQMFKDVTLVVEKGVTTTSLSIPAPLAFYGDAVRLEATVSPPSAPGPVTFREGTTVLGTATSGMNGVFTLTLPSAGLDPLGVGPHSIAASHVDLPDWTGSTSAGQSVRVRVNTKLTLGPVPASPVYGVPMALAATIDPLPPGAPAPTAPAVFQEGTVSLGSGTFQGGVALSAQLSPSGGTHSYGVTFAGDENYAAASLTGAAITVGQASVADVFLSSSGSPSYVGAPITFTARVASRAGTPGGSITFLVDDVAVGTRPVEKDLLSADGVAILDVSSVSLGAHVVTARYSGSSDFTAARSLVGLGHEVRGTTTATLTSSPNPSRGGEPVILTCVVTSTAGAPLGTVTFLDGATVLGTAASPASSTGTSSSWTLGTAALGAGSHSLTCAYSRQGFLDPSTSAGYPHLAGPFPTTTSITASPATITYGQAVTLTATVTTAVGTPTGSVIFSAGSRTWGPVPVGSGGTATMSDSTLEVGAYLFKAEYGGDALHQASSGTLKTNVTVVSIYNFTGFLTPLRTAGTWSSPTASGTQKLGSAIPVKWQLKDAKGAFIGDLGTLRSLLAYPVPCGVLGPPTGVTPLFLYVIPGGATGGSTFRFGSNSYIFNWDTTSGVKAGCFDLVVTLKDGTQRATIVKLQ